MSYQKLIPIFICLLIATKSIDGYECQKVPKAGQDASKYHESYLMIFASRLPAERELIVVQSQPISMTFFAKFSDDLLVSSSNFTVYFHIMKTPDHNLRSRKELVTVFWNFNNEPLSSKFVIKSKSQNVVSVSYYTEFYVERNRINNTIYECPQRLVAITVVSKEEDYSGIYFCQGSYSYESQNYVFSTEPLHIYTFVTKGFEEMQVASYTFGAGTEGDWRFFICDIRFSTFRYGKIEMSFSSSDEMIKNDFSGIAIKTYYSDEICDDCKTKGMHSEDHKFEVADKYLLVSSFTYYARFDKRKLIKSKSVHRKLLFVTALNLNRINNNRKFKCGFKMKNSEIHNTTVNNVGLKPYDVKIIHPKTEYSLYNFSKAVKIECFCKGYPKPKAIWSMVSNVSLEMKGNVVFIKNDTKLGKYILNCCCKNQYGESNKIHVIIISKGNIIRRFIDASLPVTITLALTIIGFTALYRLMMEDNFFHRSSITRRFTGSIGQRSFGKLSSLDTTSR